MLGASRDLLWSLFQCDLYALESYIRPAPTNHMLDNLFRHSASRTLCQQPVCQAFKPGDTWEEWQCKKKCHPLNLTLAAQVCRKKPHVALKTVSSVKFCPRKSRPIFFKSCLTSSVSTALSRPAWLRGRYMLVRYEDLSRSPLQKTKEIYDFVGLAMTPSVEEWIRVNTRATNDAQAKDKFGTMRDSAANAESWRLKLPLDMVEYSQGACQRALRQLGYREVQSADELRNMNISLVQEKTFVPFL
ncbi:carbohydrate sulfotransferase 1-like [Eucyclogobius newberryi]|uniref:carbohydrate sulfotransferase 1-like n=1 Tax=Eucyclogobius newberryi TaxID=166745 RepID=UPI003B5935B4